MDIEMLQTLLSQNTANPSQMMANLLSQKSLSPEKKAILEGFLAQSAEGDAHKVDSDDAIADGIEDYVPKGEDHSSLLADAHQRIESLENILAEIALGIGACPQCMGGDTDCAECEGEGVPGTFAPERSSFEFFILPVVERLRKRRARRDKSANISQVRNVGFQPERRLPNGT